jgi:hypothetical protein
MLHITKYFDAFYEIIYMHWKQPKLFAPISSFIILSICSLNCVHHLCQGNNLVVGCEHVTHKLETYWLVLIVCIIYQWFQVMQIIG